MPFTDYLTTKVLTHVFERSSTFTPPTTLYLSAYTSAPSSLGTDGTEATGGSYARQVITYHFAVGDPGRVQNVSTITFPSMPAGAYVAFCVHDALTGGNMLSYGELTTPITLTAGEPLVASADQINQYLS